MSLIGHILESPVAYSLWSAPLNGQKLRAIQRHLKRVPTRRRILDLGCGPGTNAGLFDGAREGYLGVDLNPEYISAARRDCPHLRFVVGDAARPPVEPGGWDLVLINSLLHHLDDASAGSTLAAARRSLEEGGFAVILEPLIPEPAELMPRLARYLDRGDHFRSRGDWRSLIRGAGFEIRYEECFPLSLFHVRGWTMLSLLLEVTGRRPE